MYSSWFKNDPDEDTWEPPSRSSNAGTIWFVSMFITSFVLVGLAVFVPNPGLYIAACGFPVTWIVFLLWLLRLLRI
ncbi:MAG TPA: hypothetical protein DCE76_04750 [Anaerolineaceae bacterium]|nr:hypothetical protein [Anaerolineaceae bacterium]